MQNILKLGEKNISYVLSMLLGWLFSLSLVSGLIYLTVLDTSFSQLAFMSFCGILFSAVIFYNKYTLVISAVAVGLFSFYAYDALTGYEPPLFLLERAWLLYETRQFITGEIVFNSALNNSTLWLLALSISTLSAILLRLKFSFPLIFAIGVGVFMSVNLASPTGLHWSFLLLVMTLMLILIARTGNSSARVLILAPVCAIVIAVAGLVPMPDVSAGRRMLEDIYEEVYWIVREPFMPRYFSSQWLGFEDRDGRLGGNLSPSGDFIMWVFADEPTYLAGATQNIYTGASWISSLDEYDFTHRYSPDFTGMRNFEFSSHPGQSGPGVFMIDDGFGYAAEQRRLSINIGRARTGTIFRPPNSIELDIYGDYEILQRGMDLRVAPVFRRNASYSFYHYSIDIENEYIQNTLLRSHRGFYRAQVDELRYELESSSPYRQMNSWSDVFTLSAIEIMEDVRIPYSDMVFANYTLLPVTLPERVIEHTFSIVEGYESDFERATAIKNYLRSMPYSLTPGYVPPDRDFVDYFLFDVREGYCTYFASAMAVMARVIGLPSRYNVGFMLPNYEAGEGFFAVYGVNAHAWAEIYFEGVGWVIFEATPPYLWNQPYGSGLTAFDTDWDDWWSEEYFEMEWFDYLLSLEDFAITTGGIAGPDREDAAQINPALVVALAFILFSGSYMFIKKSAEDKRHAVIRGDQYHAAVLEGFKGLVDLMSFYGLPMNMFESAIGYTKRIEKLAPLGAMQLRTAAEIFGRARYSNIEISEQDAEFIKRNYFLMYKKIQDSREQRVRFFVHRYIKRL